MAGEDAQRLLLVRAQLTRDLIDHAQGTQGVAIGGDQRGAGVKADLGVGSDEGAIGKTLVPERIGHNEQVILVDGVGAEGDISQGFANTGADFGLEPLPFFIHEADESDRGLTDPGSQLGEIIKNLLGDGIEDLVLPKDFEPFGLVGRDWSVHGISIFPRERSYRRMAGKQCRFWVNAGDAGPGSRGCCRGKWCGQGVRAQTASVSGWRLGRNLDCPWDLFGYSRSRLPGRMKQHVMKLILFLAAGLGLSSAMMAADLRIGIIGCDTSHVTAFTEAINNPQAKGHIPGGKVIAAYRGGSADIPSSASRVAGYVQELQQKHGVKIYDSIEELCTNVDVVLLESVDGRPHLEQVKPVLRAGKPVFIDKPMAGSLRDALEIFRLAKAANVPVFSSSALRFSKDNQAVRQGSLGAVSYAETYGPCAIEPHHPDLFWYGIHGVESLFTIMGVGCESVQRGTTTNGAVEVVGVWKGGRKGVYRADEKGFHGLAKGEKGEGAAGTFDGYVPLVEAIMQFFKTGVAPVKPEEIIEILAFMEAADQSKKQGGGPIQLSEVIAKAGGMP